MFFLYNSRYNRCAKYVQYKVTIPAAVLPLDLNFVKNYLKVDTDADDALITLLIGAVTDFAQTYTRRTFIATQYKTYRDCFTQGPCCGIELEQSPLITLDSFTYVNQDNVITVVDPAIYYVTDEVDYSKILRNCGQSYPIDIACRKQAITILFTAGFGTSPDDVPFDIQSALLQLIADMYTNRGDCSVTSRRAASCSCSTFLTAASKEILSMYRIVSV